MTRSVRILFLSFILCFTFHTSYIIPAQAVAQVIVQLARPIIKKVAEKLAEKTVEKTTETIARYAASNPQALQTAGVACTGAAYSVVEYIWPSKPEPKKSMVAEAAKAVTKPHAGASNLPTAQQAQAATTAQPAIATTTANAAPAATAADTSKLNLPAPTPAAAPPVTPVQTATPITNIANPPSATATKVFQHLAKPLDTQEAAGTLSASSNNAHSTLNVPQKNSATTTITTTINPIVPKQEDRSRVLAAQKTQELVDTANRGIPVNVAQHNSSIAGGPTRYNELLERMRQQNEEHRKKLQEQAARDAAKAQQKADKAAAKQAKKTGAPAVQETSITAPAKATTHQPEAAPAIATFPTEIAKPLQASPAVPKDVSVSNLPTTKPAEQTSIPVVTTPVETLPAVQSVPEQTKLAQTAAIINSSKTKSLREQFAQGAGHEAHAIANALINPQEMARNLTSLAQATQHAIYDIVNATQPLDSAHMAGLTQKAVSLVTDFANKTNQLSSTEWAYLLGKRSTDGAIALAAIEQVSVAIKLLSESAAIDNHVAQKLEAAQKNLNNQGKKLSGNDKAKATNGTPGQNLPPDDEDPKKKLLDKAKKAAKGAVKDSAKGLAEGAAHSPTKLSEFVRKLDPSIGDLEKLEQAVEKLKDVPGAMAKDGPITRLLKSAKSILPDGELTTARGAAFEIEKAFDLTKVGHKVKEFGQKIRGKSTAREFDIITESKVIECKAFEWLKLDAKTLSDRLGKIKDQANVAAENGKLFELHSKHPFSEEAKKWLIEKSIKFFEG